jgi:hypothetical protein
MECTFLLLIHSVQAAQTTYGAGNRYVDIDSYVWTLQETVRYLAVAARGGRTHRSTDRRKHPDCAVCVVERYHICIGECLSGESGVELTQSH